MSLVVAVRLTADSQGLVSGIRVSERELSRLGTSSDETARDLDTTSRAARGTGLAFRALATGIAAIGLTQLVRDIVNVNAKFEGYERSLRLAMGSTIGAKREMEFLRAETDRLGISFEGNIKGYSRLAVAAKNTSLAGEGIREVWLGIVEAGRVFNSTAAENEGSLRAIEQMLNKSAVQAEELTGQLGERLLGALNLTAKGYNTTTAELLKMITTGTVLAEDLLPRLTKELRALVAPEIENAAKGISAQIERLKNEFLELQLAVGNSGLIGLLSEIVQGATASVGAITDIAEALGLVTTALNDQSVAALSDKMNAALDDRLDLLGDLAKAEESLRKIEEQSGRLTRGRMNQLKERRENVQELQDEIGTLTDQINVYNERLLELTRTSDGAGESQTNLAGNTDVATVASDKATTAVAAQSQGWRTLVAQMRQADRSAVAWAEIQGEVQSAAEVSTGVVKELDEGVRDMGAGFDFAADRAEISANRISMSLFAVLTNATTVSQMIQRMALGIAENAFIGLASPIIQGFMPGAAGGATGWLLGGGAGASTAIGGPVSAIGTAGSIGGGAAAAGGTGFMGLAAAAAPWVLGAFALSEAFGVTNILGLGGKNKGHTQIDFGTLPPAPGMPIQGSWGQNSVISQGPFGAVMMGGRDGLGRSPEMQLAVNRVSDLDEGLAGILTEEEIARGAAAAQARGVAGTRAENFDIEFQVHRRYEDIFDAIGGPLDELYDSFDVSKENVEKLVALMPALSKLTESSQELAASWELADEAFGAGVVALAGLEGFLDTDPITAFEDALAEQSRTLWEVASDTGDALRELTGEYDGSLQATIELANATAGYAAIEQQALAQIEMVRGRIEGGSQTLRRQISRDTMSDDEYQAQLQAEVTGGLDLLGKLEDPALIAQTAADTQRAIRESWNLLSDEEKVKQQAKYERWLDDLDEVSGGALDDARTVIQEQGEAIREAISDAMAQPAEDIKDTSKSMEHSAVLLSAAAATLQRAASEMRGHGESPQDGGGRELE